MVEYPEMRAEAIGALKALSDFAYQRRMWVDEVGQHPGIVENLDINIHILYDDTGVAEEPRARIGTVLENENEARALEELDRVLGPFIDALDPGVNDATVIAMPEWRDVVRAAQKALGVLTEGGPPSEPGR